MTNQSCSICKNICGAHREHCPVCGSSRGQVFWLFDGPNTWSKSHIDYDRPIGRARSMWRDNQVKFIETPDGQFTVIDDVALGIAHELAE